MLKEKFKISLQVDDEEFKYCVVDILFELRIPVPSDRRTNGATVSHTSIETAQTEQIRQKAAATATVSSCSLSDDTRFSLNCVDTG